MDREEYDTAIGYFEKAVKLDPEWFAPYYNLGRVYEEMFDFETSKKYYKKAIELNAPNSGYLDDRLLGFENNSDMIKAVLIMIGVALMVGVILRLILLGV